MTGADVLMSVSPYEPAVRRLILQQVGAAQRLTWSQNHGGACVWCARSALQAGGLMPLGGHLGWNPHACRSCYALRLQYVQSYLGWARHVDRCPPCRLERCPDSAPFARATMSLYVLLEVHPVIDTGCIGRCVLPPDSPLVRPREDLWQDSTGRIGYAHTGPCSRTGGSTR
ncbi:hypothetical protein ACIQJX_34910 [Streptomyces griseoviridis]